MILFIDGLDRCCKDSLIDHLRSILKRPEISVRHEGKPPKNVDPLVWSIQHYEYFFNELKDINYDEETIIYNRSHLGELIYGPLYRKYNADFILDLEYDFTQYSTEDVYLIVLVDSGKNIMARSDGLSIEQNEESFDKSKTAFTEAFTKSHIKNKILIDLDNGNGSISKQEVFERVEKFIGLK